MKQKAVTLKNTTNKEKPPVVINDKIELTITSVGKKSDGISKINNFVIIVPQAKLLHKYNVLITEVKDSFAFATILNEVH